MVLLGRSLLYFRGMPSLLSIGQVIDRSLDHYRHHFKELLAVSLWLLIAYIPWIAGELIGVYGSGSDIPTTPTDWIAFALRMIGFLATLVAGIWTFIALVLATDEQAKRGQSNLETISKKSWTFFLPYIWVSILLVVLFAAIVLIALPGIVLFILGVTTNTAIFSLIAPVLFFIGTPLSAYLLLKFGIETAFAPYTLMLQNERGPAAISASRTLVKGRWFATFMRFVVPKLVYFLVIFVASFIVFQALAYLTIFVASLNSLLALAAFGVSMILGILVSVLTTPLIVVTDYYLYDSLRQSR